jgi:hypothetical protein
MNLLRRILMFVVGASCMVMALSSWREDSVYVHSRLGESRTIAARQDRASFWFAILGYAGFGAFCFYYAFRKRDDD